MAPPLVEIAKSIRRVRFSEAGFQGKTEKVVWHQGREGCELITRVDRQGKVIEHELTLRGDVAVWRREQPIKTGKLRQEAHENGDRGTGPRAHLMDLDAAPRMAVVEESAMLAELVPGNDRYILHLAMVMRAALSGATTVGAEVTTVSGMKRPKQVAEAAAEAKKKGLKGLVSRLIGK